jgi:hypothetical protein
VRALPDDRLIHALQILAILLFVSVPVLSLARSRYPWAKWAGWGSVVVFLIACLCAGVGVLRWGLSGNY